MSSKTNIFMTGITGYLGGTVLENFLRHPDSASFNITGLVRSEEKAKKLKTRFGVNAVVGSHSDLALLEELAAGSDTVVTMADVDDLDAAKAILRGLKKRHEKTGQVPTLIHTSGTGVLTDNAAGMYAYETIYNDLDPDQIETLAPTQFHRNVDLEVLGADKESYVKTHIIVPSTIWGIASTPLTVSGIQNPFSIQIPQLIKASLDRGQAGMVGEGKNLWPNVHIYDIASLYVVLFDAIKKNPSAVGHGREGFYFGENGEHSLYEVGKAIGEALVQLRKSKDPEPTTFTKEEIDKYLGGSVYLGSNSRCRGNRSRAIGWKPLWTKEDMLAYMKTEIEGVISAEFSKPYRK